GVPQGALAPVSVAGLSSQANATENVELRGNLQADAPLIGPFDATSFDPAYATTNFPTSVRVFDSLGKAHDVFAFFTRTGSNTWSVNFGVDDGEVGGTPGDLNILST